MATASPTALIISTNYGTETDEILKSIENLRAAGVDVTVAAVEDKPIGTLVLDAEPGPDVTPDTTLDAVDAAGFDALVIPGGTLNSDALRVNERAQQLARSFAADGKLIAAVCHGPWLLAETELSVGKNLTSYSSIRTDLVNAGATWVDEEVVIDGTNGFTLVTSRTPFDMAAFTAAIVDAVN